LKNINAYKTVKKYTVQNLETLLEEQALLIESCLFKMNNQHQGRNYKTIKRENPQLSLLNPS